MKKRETIEITIKKMLFPNIGIAVYDDIEVRVKHA